MNKGTKKLPQNQAIKKKKIVEDMNESNVSKIERYLFSKYQFRYNEVSNDTEIKTKNSQNEFKTFDDRLMADLRLELANLSLKGAKQHLDDILRSSKVPTFNPFSDYFENLPKWNEATDPDHIQNLCHYIVAKDQVWFDRMFKKHLVRTVACALRMIDFNKHCFVFHSKQNVGKSMFLRHLTPTKLKPYYKENPPLDHKDSVLALSQNFIVNLDELHSLDKTDANKVKSLISLSDTKVRNHYATKDTLQKRYSSFFGSINDTQFLNDVTGNVRWLVFDILQIIHDNGGENGYSKIDIDLVWSQAYHLAKSEEYKCQLTQDEIQEVERVNVKYAKSFYEKELMEKYFYAGSKDDKDSFAVSSSEIVEALYEVTNIRTRINSIQIGKALKSMGIESQSVRTKNSNSPTYKYFLKTENEVISEFLSKQPYCITTKDLTN